MTLLRTYLGKYNLFFSRYVFKPRLMCSSRALLSCSFSSNPVAQVAFSTYKMVRIDSSNNKTGPQLTIIIQRRRPI